jgi:DNA-binding MarR family transcriptional regulator
VKKEDLIIEKLNKIFFHINQESKKSRDYGIGYPLYQSEIHTLEAIHHHHDLKLSDLSAIMGIANSSFTEMTNKLVSKGLIEKYKLETNKKEVYYRLTDLGQTAYEGHRIYHKEIFTSFAVYLESKTPEEIDGIIEFLDTLIAEFYASN